MAYYDGNDVVEQAEGVLLAVLAMVLVDVWSVAGRGVGLDGPWLD